MIKAMIASGLLLAFVACNNESQTRNSADSSKVDSIVKRDSTQMADSDTAIGGCYSMISGRDTATLQLAVKGTSATGTLKYKYFEKDRNDGSFTGDLQGGVLMGWYLFRSEGILSVRQVAWKVTPGALSPATGDMLQSHDTLKFKDPANISFQRAQEFRKVPCVI